jgi:tetratricopeptide (TPR) repeat protein
MAKQPVPEPSGTTPEQKPTPPEQPEHLPHLFKWRDWAVALAAFLIAGGRFLYDMSPEVTLQDSGELVTGAYHLGVPHPPGYPMWALMGWIWRHMIPFGNPAWQICLLSVVTGALVVGVLTLLMSRSTMVLLRSLSWADEVSDNLKHWIALTVGAAVSLTFGFNRGVWLWACVPEMRVLNVFMFVLTACTFFAWMLRPKRHAFLYVTILVYGLGIANHQTIMVMVAPFLAGAIALELLDALGFQKAAAFRDAALVALKRDWIPAVGTLVTLVVLMQIGAALPQSSRVWVMNHWGEFGARLVSFGVAGPKMQWLLGNFVKITLVWWVSSTVLGVLTRVSQFKVAMELVVAVLLSAAAWSFVMAWTGMRMLKEFMPVPLVGMLPLEAVAVLLTVLGIWYLVYAWMQRLVNGWRALLCTLVFLIGVGFYAYMPIASATNPPMNWGYSRTPQGFLHHITRGQYERLHPQSLFSREFFIQVNLFTTSVIKQYSLFFENTGGGIASLAKSASNIINALLLGLVSVGLPLLAFRDLQARARSWLIFVWSAFAIASIGLIMIINPQLDRQNQEICIKFFAPAQGFFAMMFGYGLAFALAGLAARFKQLPRPTVWVAAALLLLLPFIPFYRNWRLCEQRGHDFGYQFGYRMFYPGGDYPPMDKDAVLYGGTDPGRFVPTYMIFCESRAKAKDRFNDSHFDPQGGRNFDRRDVYIITQNALADSTYMSYIRDHYDFSRPDWNNPATLTNRPSWQNRQLGWAWLTLDRATMYPRDPIWIPSELDVQRAFQEYVNGLRNRAPSPEEQVEVVDGRVSVKGVAGVMNINGILTKWIFDRNKDKHSFYVEESYVIPWMYPYLEPAGIIMKINKEPLPAPQENPALWGMIIKRDRAYWDKLEAEFMARPVFKRDTDAQKTFSKLRSAIGGVYAFRRLVNEAEYAYKQAQRLCAESPEASFRCAQLYMELGQVDKAIDTLKALEELDPLNTKITEARRQLEAAKKAREDIVALESARRTDPRNIQLFMQLAQAYARAGQLDRIIALCDSSLAIPDLNGGELVVIAQTFLQIGQVDRALAVLQRALTVNPRDSQALYAIAIIRANQNALNEALDALEKAIQITPQLRDQSRNDPRLAPLRFNQRFQQLTGTGQPLPKF